MHTCICICIYIYIPLPLSLSLSVWTGFRACRIVDFMGLRAEELGFRPKVSGFSVLAWAWGSTSECVGFGDILAAKKL